MANELMEKVTTYEVNGEEVKLNGKMIKSFLVSGNAEVTDQEVVMFLQLCKYQKLNPFLKEAYLVKYKSKKENVPDAPAQIIVSKEAFMKRAESSPQYCGLKAGIIVDRDGELVEIEGAIKLNKDKLVGGWAKVYRKDREHPITVKISLNEFSKGQSTWNNMPLTMIRKTAIVNAMREAFPDNLGAMYTEEENQAADQAFSVEQEIKTNANSEVINMDEVIQEQKEQPKQEPIQENYEAPINESKAPF